MSLKNWERLFRSQEQISQNSTRKNPQKQIVHLLGRAKEDMAFYSVKQWRRMSFTKNGFFTFQNSILNHIVKSSSILLCNKVAIKK